MGPGADWRHFSRETGLTGFRLAQIHDVTAAGDHRGETASRRDPVGPNLSRESVGSSHARRRLVRTQLMTTQNEKALLCVAVLVAIQTSTLRVSAECISLTACEALRQASVVFVADIIEVGSPEERISQTQSRPAPQPLRFKIIERFKGLSPDQQEISAKIAFSSAETVFVAAGKRYLVYARQRSDGTWDTNCSATKLVDEAAHELAELRQCPVR